MFEMSRSHVAGKCAVFPVARHQFYPGSVIKGAQSVREVVLELAFVFPSVLHFENTFTFSHSIFHVAGITPFVVEEKDVGGIDLFRCIDFFILFD